MKQTTSRRIRILQLPHDYAGQASLLRDNFNSQGHYSELWTFSSHPYYPEPDKKIFSNSSNRIFKLVSMLRAANYVFGKWDIVLYNGGSSLFSVRVSSPFNQPFGAALMTLANYCLGTLQRLELLVLRLRGVKLFIVYQGDDLRQGDRSRELFQVSVASEVDSDYYGLFSDGHKRRQAHLFSTFCEKSYLANPDLFNFHFGPAYFLPNISRQAIVVPPSINQRPKKSEVFRIVHAPTHRDAKGTKYVIDSIKRLRKRGFEIELQLVEGMTNADALRAYSEADLVIDQLLAGWYGVLAVECMSMGKPVMAFVREVDLKYIPKEMATNLPIICTSPKTLEVDLEKVIGLGRPALEELGLASLGFVDEWHNPARVASTLVSDFLFSISVSRESK